MSNVVNTTTGEYRVSVNEPDFPQPLWIWSPDLSAFAAIGGYKAKYAVLVTNSLPQLMTQAQRDAVDAAEAASVLAQDKVDQKARIDSERILKALALTIMDEINILRAANSLAARTANQLVTAVKNKVDTI